MAPAQSKISIFPFLELPPEIRIRIYGFAVPQQIKISTLRHSTLTGYCYSAKMLLDVEDRPRFMFASKAIRNEVLPIFQQRLTPVVTSTSPTSWLTRFGLTILHFEKALDEKIEQLILTCPNNWQDHLARQAFIHPNLKAIDLKVAWHNNMYAYTPWHNMPPLGTNAVPFRLSSYFFSLCEYILYQQFSASSYTAIDLRSLCNRYSIRMTIVNWPFKCFKWVIPGKVFGCMQYSGEVTVKASVNYEDPQILPDRVKIRTHREMTLLDSYAPFADPGNTARGFEWDPEDKSRQYWFWSILIQKELE